MSKSDFEWVSRGEDSPSYGTRHIKSDDGSSLGMRLKGGDSIPNGYSLGLNISKENLLERNAKISKSTKGMARPYVATTTNKNPDKIAKTAAKHRGMKRSDEAKQNMSNALLEAYANGAKPSILGRCAYNNELTKETKYFTKDEQPDGWIKGNGLIIGKLSYLDPINKITKRFLKDQQPEGWVKGNYKES
jgi:hypothetical protein